MFSKKTDVEKIHNSVLKKTKKLDKSLEKKDYVSGASILTEVISDLLSVEDYKYLAHIIQSYDSEMTWLKNHPGNLNGLSQSAVQKAAHELSKEGQFDISLCLLDAYRKQEDILIYLAELGRDNELADRVINYDGLTASIVRKVINTWEKKNGDFRKKPVLIDMIRKVADKNIDVIPDDARIKEMAGQISEAAALYEKENDYANAARCYEQVNNDQKAYELFAKVKNRDGISRTAEKLGNYEEALQYASIPERRSDLLVKLGRFNDALKEIVGLRDYDKKAAAIRQRAKEHLDRFVRDNDYLSALDVLSVLEENNETKADIIAKGRQYYSGAHARAKDDAQAKSIIRDWIRLEELAGNFEDAAQMAENMLHDFELASIIYEKANLFNKAITSMSGTDDPQKARIRIAELHEKGGNLLSAAKIFEQAGVFDRASVIYAQLSNYEKAAECYEQYPQHEKVLLADYFEKCGNYEKAIAIWIDLGTLPDLEKALRIAHDHGLYTHEKAISSKIEKMTANEEDVLKLLVEAEQEINSTYTACLGIDFGTTNSVGAIYNKRSKKVEIVPAPGTGGMGYEPSCFGVDSNNKPLFGEKARIQAQREPNAAVSRVKRSMGKKKSFTIGKRQYKAEEIAAMIINRIKDNAERYIYEQKKTLLLSKLQKAGIRYPEDKVSQLLSEKSKGFELSNVILTVPAFYNDNQKRATRDAAEVAGLHVKRLLHEPTSAALAYGYQKEYTGNIIVVDLGGGTLDLSYLEVGDNVYEVIDVDGDIQLGGSDIDQALLDYALKYLQDNYKIVLSPEKDIESMNRLRDACETLKITLSDMQNSALELHHFMGVPVVEMPLSRKQLEDISSSILTRFKDKLFEFVRKTNSFNAKYLLVGNATKMPAIADIVGKNEKLEVLRGIDPGTVVAVGAALEGAVLCKDIKETLLLDIVPYSLGIEIEGKAYSKILDHGTTIPVTKMQTYTTTKDNQKEATIKVYQGERQMAYDNYYLGSFSIGDIQPAPKGIPQIEVEFKIESNCILTVTARNKATGHQQSIRIDGAVTLSPKEKENLKSYFSSEKQKNASEASLAQEKTAILSIVKNAENTILNIKRELVDFAKLFKEKVQDHPGFYSATSEDYQYIQNMFMRKDSISSELQRVTDRVHSLQLTAEKVMEADLDHNDDKAVEKINEKFQALQSVKSNLTKALSELDNDIHSVVAQWNQVLRSMKPDYTKMNILEAIGSCLAAGNYADARKLLSEMEESPEGLSEDAFRMLLKCNIHMGRREEYKDAHQKYGYLFGLIYPDFNRLDSYLSRIGNSIVMIMVETPKGACSGSGFAVKEHVIVTNRHVVESATPLNIRIIGREKTSKVVAVKIDPVADLALLQVEADFPPLRIGEFNFVSPGEQVITIGFPSPNSESYKENIYISKGIVNSIRKFEHQPERVIFIDAKIASGMSGGPLINDLGEVIGINTMTSYNFRDVDQGHVIMEDQHIAISTRLLEKYL